MDQKPNTKIIQMPTRKTESGSSPTSNCKRKQEAPVPDEVDKPPSKHFKAELPPSLNKHNTWSASSDEKWLDGEEEEESDDEEKNDRTPRTVPYISRFFSEERGRVTYPYIMRLFRDQNSESSEIITNLKRMYPNFSSALSHEDIKHMLGGASAASDLESKLKKATLARMQWKSREARVLADISSRFVTFFEFMETRSFS